MKLINYFVFFQLLILCIPSIVIADHNDRFDSTPVWPLCGRISENPPIGWDPLIPTCPSTRWGNSDQTDFPLSSTFGSRQQASQAFRYDFHRGIDIPTAIGTPVFAVADGVVLRAGTDPLFSDTLIQIEHKSPGHTDCSSGCYYSNYFHLALNSWVVSAGDTVTKGQYLANAGPGLSGFEHLHFEIREAPGDHDPESAWQRDAIHPLLILPYQDSGASNMQLSIDNIDVSNPVNPIVSTTVSMENGIELDLNRIEIEVYEKIPNAFPQLVPQPGNQSVGNTPEGTGYHVYPAWFDMLQFNRQYSYKDSTLFPWSAFSTGGIYESPFAALLPTSYDPNIHLDQNAGIGEESRGEFNGLIIAPAQFNISSAEYGLSITFNQLIGPANSDNLCLRARAEDILGNTTEWVENNCGGVILTPISGLTTSEAGGSATFSVVINSQPTATSEVNISLSSSNPNEGIASPSTLSFTSTNWNIPQIVTVVGVDDSLVDGDIVYTINTTIITDDPNYSGANPVDIAVINSDNDINSGDDDNNNDDSNDNSNNGGNSNTNIAIAIPIFSPLMLVFLNVFLGLMVCRRL